MPSVGASQRSFSRLLGALPKQEAISWPVYRRPWALAAWIVLTCVVVGALAWRVHLGAAALALGVLLASAVPLAIPTRFSFQLQGIFVRKGFWKRRILWTEIDRIEKSGSGLTIVASGGREFGSTLDGFYLHCPKPADRDAFLQALESLRDARRHGSSIVRRAESSAALVTSER